MVDTKFKAGWRGIKQCLECKEDFMSTSGSRRFCDACIERKSICSECNGSKDIYHQFWGTSGIRRSTQVDGLELINWRRAVFSRDKYTCQYCGQEGGRLNAHHIKEWAKYPEFRLDLNNGLTLCIECHKGVHKKRRFQNVTRISSQYSQWN